MFDLKKHSKNTGSSNPCSYFSHSNIFQFNETHHASLNDLKSTSDDVSNIFDHIPRVLIERTKLKLAKLTIEALESRFTVKKLLQNSSWSTIHIIQERTTSDLYVQKKISKFVLMGNCTYGTEFSKLIELNHPNVISLEYFVDTPDCFYIITKYYQPGDVLQTLEENSELSNFKIMLFMFETLLALQYCHSNNVLHGDLKPENIIVASTHTYPMIKLIDFGCSSKLENETDTVTSHKGTFEYLAPEASNNLIGFHSDIWSLGYTMFNTLCLKHGVDIKKNFDTPRNSEKIFDHDYISNMLQDKVSPKCIAFLAKTLTHDLESRPTAAEALFDDCFKELIVAQSLTFARFCARIDLIHNLECCRQLPYEERSNLNVTTAIQNHNPLCRVQLIFAILKFIASLQPTHFKRLLKNIRANDFYTWRYFKRYNQQEIFQGLSALPIALLESIFLTHDPKNYDFTKVVNFVRQSSSTLTEQMCRFIDKL